jgi:hypothetical protein
MRRFPGRKEAAHRRRLTEAAEQDNRVGKSYRFSALPFGGLFKKIGARYPEAPSPLLMNFVTC